MPEDLHLEAAAATHAGHRRTNADAFLTFDAGGLFAVADGMGDGPASSVAARIAVESVRMRFRETWMWLPIEERSLEGARMRLAHGVALAHTRLYRPGAARVERIGTTFAGLVICGPGGGMLCLAHVGNSRILLLRRRPGTIEQLTRDHTLRDEGPRRGLPAPSASGVFRRDALTRAVGATRNAAPDLGTTEWEPGDVALLCTNGVSDWVPPNELAEVLFEEPDLGVAARRIVQRAVATGGWDNATLVLVRRQEMRGSSGTLAPTSDRPEETCGGLSILRQRSADTPDSIDTGPR